MNSNWWTWEEDKLFENALADVPEDVPDRWQLVAARVPGRTPAEVEEHYRVLVEDVNAIEAGLVPVPKYADDVEDESASAAAAAGPVKKRKGTPWTEEEHKLFLIGLEKYGKGDWRSISRNTVVTRTPTQVASHAQKYFCRKSSNKKEKKRSSIHDVTVNEADLLRVSNQMVPMNNPSQQQQQQQQQIINNSQVAYPNHGGAAIGYQYGFAM